VIWWSNTAHSTVLAGFDAKWPVLSFVVAGLELGIMHLFGETQWLTARYAKAKRPSNAQSVREQGSKEARIQCNVAIAEEPERKRATIAVEAEKSKFRPPNLPWRPPQLAASSFCGAIISRISAYFCSIV